MLKLSPMRRESACPLFDWVIFSAPSQNQCWRWRCILCGFFSAEPWTGLAREFVPEPVMQFFLPRPPKKPRQEFLDFIVPWIRRGHSLALRLHWCFSIFTPGPIDHFF